MKFWNWLKNLFTTSEEVVETPTEFVSTESDTCTNVSSNVTVLSTTEPEQSEYPTDILGNTLRPGDYVVRVKYNELNRRGYFTIEEDHDVVAFNTNMRFKVVKKDVLDTLTYTIGRKHGYLHVACV